MINTSEKLETGIIGDIFSCNIKLEEGEVLCDKCNGRGVSEKYSNAGDYTVVCQKCQGDGKLDWVSKITGKPPKMHHGTSGCGIYGTSGCGIYGTSGFSETPLNLQNFTSVVENIVSTKIAHTPLQDKIKIKKTIKEIINKYVSFVLNKLYYRYKSIEVKNI